MKTDIVIIGASAAGLSAAMTLKNLSPDQEIILFRNVSSTPVPCGIPYIYGTLKDVSKDIIPDTMLHNLGIEIKIANVDCIDPKTKTVYYNNEKEQMNYNRLLLATGSIPFVPPIEGIGLKNIFTVKKDPKKLESINEAVKDTKQIVVIGGGFIGVEMAEQLAVLKGKGAKVTIVEMLPHCLMNACELDLCIAAEKELAMEGIEILTNAQVTAFEGDESGQVKEVVLKDGTRLQSDLVIIGIGAAPNIELAKKSGIPCDERAGVKVNEHLKTPVDEIYAAGDCTEKISFITGKPSGIRLASVAAYEGLVVANNLLGKKIKNKGAVGAFSTKIGKVTLGAAGLTTTQCTKEGIEYVIGEFTGPDRHPATLPGVTKDMKAILIFKKSDRTIIGGHIKGGLTTGEMINIISTAIQAKLTVDDIYHLQVATHPLLTGSPIAYHILKAAENAYLQF